MHFHAHGPAHGPKQLPAGANSANIKFMNKLNQNSAQAGAISGLAISLTLTVLLLLGAIGFGYWAYSERQDYKDNSDTKVTEAVKKAVAKEDIKKDKQFAEAYKKPLRTYKGPEAAGSIAIKYPKTWSGFIKDDGSGSQPALDAYFSSGEVPPVDKSTATFALHVQLVSQSYSQVLQGFEGQQRNGEVTVKAYSLPKLPKVVGVKVVGKIRPEKEGTVIVLPLRSQTLQIQTDGTKYLRDFDKYILPNFNFSP